MSRSATGPPCGKRIVAGRIVKESYGAAKQQHTFTVSCNSILLKLDTYTKWNASIFFVWLLVQMHYAILMSIVG